MIEQLLADAEAAPDLFWWNGPIPQQAVQRWVENSGFAVPEELAELWHQTGGGDAFESETFLRPLAAADDPDNIEVINAYLRSQGMGDRYFVFHTGLCLSTVRQPDGAIVCLDESTFKEKATFPSLEDWYRRLIRAEYAAQYGLAQPS